MKNRVLFLLGIFTLTMVFFSCKAEIEEPQTRYYTVTYSSEHGTVPNAISVEENSFLTEEQLPVLSEENWVFKGWYDGNSKVEASRYQVKGDVVLSARWDQTATVAFNTPFGDVPPLNKMVDETISELEIPELNQNGYTFCGWYNGTTKLTSGYTVNGDVTFNAKWTVRVSYESEFGIIPENFDIELNGALGYADLPYVLNDENQAFLGWYYSKDEINNGTGVKANYGDIITEEVTLYAQWMTNTVSFVTKYGDAPQPVKKFLGRKLSASEIPSLTHEGCKFEGWFHYYPSVDYNEKLTPDYYPYQDITFTARWTPNLYKLYFNMNGGSGNNYSYNVEYDGSINISPREILNDDGSILAGWNTMPDGSGTSMPNDTSFSFHLTEPHDATLYAQWDNSVDESTIVQRLRKMKKSGTLVASGTFNSDLITEINKALKNLSSDVLVTLDLSAVTGLTRLERAGPYTEEERSRCFYGCSNLKKIILPESLSYIGSYSFAYCSNLTDAVFVDTQSTWYGKYNVIIGNMSATDTAENARKLKSTYVEENLQKK